MSLYRDIKFLICSVCKNYLSCGPVFIRKQRFSVCGRCTVRFEKGIRNHVYELSASRTRFPCCYRNFGCQETQAFTDAFVYSHEYACEFRKYKCVFTDDDDEICPWEDFKSKIVGHCETTHPDKLINNCCTLKFDVRYPYQSTYLLIAFEMEFMLHVKIYIPEDSINRFIAFQLEYLGKQEAGAQFQYTLNIQKDRSLVTKIGTCRILTATEVEVDSLGDIFNGFEGVTYHFTVSVRCATCDKEQILGKLFNQGPHWYCVNCTPEAKVCVNKNKGCTFNDDSLKISKHEKYFCKYSNTSLGVNIREYGKIWMVRRVTDKIVLTTDIGFVITEFTSIKTDGKFEIFIYSPLTNYEELDFSCKVCIGNPYTGESLILYPEFQHKEEYDWYCDVDRIKYPSWGSELAILVVVQRNPIIPPADELY